MSAPETSGRSKARPSRSIVKAPAVAAIAADRPRIQGREDGGPWDAASTSAPARMNERGRTAASSSCQKSKIPTKAKVPAQYHRSQAVWLDQGPKEENPLRITAW